MRRIIICCIVLLSGVAGHAQSGTVGISTNALYWGAITPNIGMEYAFARQWSLHVMGAYAPWKFDTPRKYRAWAIQPELRLWCCEAMTRHYVGMHFHYARYNIGEKDFRRDGDLKGGGLSYGYIWVIDKRWNIDFSVGAGYARMEYDKYCQECKRLVGHRSRNYWGPTKLGITFVYKIR